jgi:glycosyltransferase involved in cell wall biosynthesis
MPKNNKKNNKKNTKKEMPFVSICTPTFNRRPFIPTLIKLIENQTYPKDRLEWIIVDDGTDPIGDLIKEIPYVKYFHYEGQKMKLGKKRNIMHEKSCGDILVYFDDDDYYPPERISHAVTMLKQHPSALCAGSSKLPIYFPHIDKLYYFGPYGPKHATAGTFAFRRKMLDDTHYNEDASLAEEKEFLKNYTIPMVQLEPKKTILVVSHDHNTFDKKNLLDATRFSQTNVHITECLVSDFIKEKDIYKFFVVDLPDLLSNYSDGKTENKPDVMNELKRKDEEIKNRKNQNDEETQIQINQNGQSRKLKTSEVVKIIQDLTEQNNKLKTELNSVKKELEELKNNSSSSNQDADNKDNDNKDDIDYLVKKYNISEQEAEILLFENNYDLIDTISYLDKKNNSDENIKLEIN